MLDTGGLRTENHEKHVRNIRCDIRQKKKKIFPSFVFMHLQ